MMSEDPTRAMPTPGTPAREVPAYGRVGPADPHADPATHPGLRPADVDGPATDPGIPAVRVGPPEPPTVPTAQPPQSQPPQSQPPQPEPALGHSRSGGLWTGLILSAIVLIFLLVFILQNQISVTIRFLGFAGSVPVGVALLLAAIAGLLLVAIPGGVRIMQLRRAARRAARR
jgi:uncharacterized integral membrane protein